MGARQTVRRLTPAILASMLIVFALSIDDFVVTQYMSSSGSTTTIPMLLYSNARGGATTPALNAVATIMVVVTLIGVAGVANLNLAVANVALPDIGKAFDAGQTAVDLIAVGYSLGLAASVLYLGEVDPRSFVDVIVDNRELDHPVLMLPR